MTEVMKLVHCVLQASLIMRVKCTFFGVRVSDNVGGDGLRETDRQRETDVNVRQCVREMDRDRGRQIDNVGERDRCSCERQLLMGDGQMETEILL